MTNMETETETREHQYTKTVPWTDDEMIRVNGHPLCYTMTSNGKYHIHFAEGVTLTKAQLIAAGAIITMPKTPREATVTASAKKAAVAAA